MRIWRLKSGSRLSSRFYRPSILVARAIIVVVGFVLCRAGDAASGPDCLLLSTHSWLISQRLYDPAQTPAHMGAGRSIQIESNVAPLPQQLESTPPRPIFHKHILHNRARWQTNRPRLLRFWLQTAA